MLENHKLIAAKAKNLESELERISASEANAEEIIENLALPRTGAKEWPRIPYHITDRNPVIAFSYWRVVKEETRSVEEEIYREWVLFYSICKKMEADLNALAKQERELIKLRFLEACLVRNLPETIYRFLNS